MGFTRVLLKVSGEALGGASGAGLDFGAIGAMAGECLEASRRGIEVGVVVGGGNFIRGAALAEAGLERVTGDQMGMLATVINGLALKGAVEGMGGKASVFSAVNIEGGVERFDAPRCRKRLEDGHVAVLVGGTGNPFFTTDTAAALRASELKCDLFLKATKVDGVYDSDPVKNPGARRYEKLSYMDVVKQRLEVMDATAVTLCMENGIPIVVFDMTKEGNVGRVLDGEAVGTVIS